MMVRQGDILLRKVDKLPKKAIRIHTDILLEGEATGHAHRIEQGEIYQYRENFYAEITVFVKAEKETMLVHEEHGSIDLEPGIYEFIRQREYDPDDQTFRWIED